MRSSLIPLAAALACAGAARADLTEIIVGRDSAGRLRVRLIGDSPVELDRSIFPGFSGWAEAEPGFESTTLDDPEGDFYIPDAAADMRWILTGIGPGIRVLRDGGIGYVEVGEAYMLGSPFFDVHPFWNIPAPTGPTFLRFIVRDASGLYTDSPEIELPFITACYANCDGSTAAPALNVLDFGCFLNAFASGDPYANCDGSTTAPQLNVLDFGCFLNRFAAGCV